MRYLMIRGFLYPVQQCVKISIVQRLIIEKIARHNGISMAEATRELIAAGIEAMNVE